MEYSLHFCLAIFWRPLTWWLSNQVLRTQNESNKRGIVVPGREKIDNQWVSKNKFMSQNSKIYFLQIFFASQSVFGKARTMWIFTFLSQARTTDRELKELTPVRILTLCLWQFFQDPLQAPDRVGVPVGLNLVARSCKGRGRRQGVVE